MILFILYNIYIILSDNQISDYHLGRALDRARVSLWSQGYWKLEEILRGKETSKSIWILKLFPNPADSGDDAAQTDSVKCNLAFPSFPSSTDMHGAHIAVCCLQVGYQNPTWIQDPWPSVNTTGTVPPNLFSMKSPSFFPSCFHPPSLQHSRWNIHCKDAPRASRTPLLYCMSSCMSGEINSNPTKFKDRSQAPGALSKCRGQAPPWVPW